MRRASCLLFLGLLLLPSPATGQEGLYNVGQLEVKGEDLSTLHLKGGRRATSPVALEAAGERRAARLVDLGDGGLSATGERSAEELRVSAGTYGTVRAGGAVSYADPDGSENVGRIDYESTDGHRFRSDRRAASASFESRNRPLAGFRGDFSASLSDGREHLPGATGSETRFVRRTARGMEARAGVAPDGTAPWSGAVSVSGGTLDGESRALALADEAEFSAAKIDAEWRPDPAGDFALGMEAKSHRLNLDRAASASASEFALAARARRELGDTLLTSEAGARKIESGDGRFEGDLTVRRKVDDRTVVRASAGRKGSTYGYRELLLSAPGYVNLRDASGGNVFAAAAHPARESRYAAAGARVDLARGWLDLSASAETVDGEAVHVARNATDPVVDLQRAGDGATIRTLAAKYARPVSDTLALSISAQSRRAREARGDLPFTPKGQAELALDYAAPRTRARVALQGFGARTVDFAGGRAAGHAEIDASVDHDLSDALALQVSADNLFNRRHDDRPGFPARGRLVTGGLEYRF